VHGNAHPTQAPPNILWYTPKPFSPRSSSRPGVPWDQRGSTDPNPSLRNATPLTMHTLVSVMGLDWQMHHCLGLHFWCPHGMHSPCTVSPTAEAAAVSSVWQGFSHSPSPGLHYPSLPASFPGPIPRHIQGAEVFTGS